MMVEPLACSNEDMAASEADKMDEANRMFKHSMRLNERGIKSSPDVAGGWMDEEG